MSELYRERYDRFIKHRQKNILFKTTDGIYVENHHIKPRSFFPKGTSDSVIDKDNTVYLTAREHFIAHCFLARMYKTGSSKWYKTNNTIITMNGKSDTHEERYTNSRLYERLKIKYYKQINKENEEKCLVELKEICDWMDINNRTPNKRSKDGIEKTMGYKVRNLKSAKQGKGKVGNFHKSYQDLVEQRGYSNLFDIVNKESIALKDINEICDFMDKYNRLPLYNSNESNQKQMYKKISHLKSAKQGKGNRTKFLQSYQDLANRRGYPKLFDVIDIEKEGLKNINEICDFIDKNGTTNLNTSSKNPIKSNIANRISNLKQSKQGRGSGKFYNSYQKLTDKRGYPDLFDVTNNEALTLKYINEICNWMDKNNKKPNQTSKDTIERKMGQKISDLRRSIKGTNSTVFHKSYHTLMEQRGYASLFANINKV